VTSGHNISGTLSGFKYDSVVGIFDISLPDVTFSGNLSKTTGQFTGAVAAGGKGIVKGTVYGPAADHIAGQFTGRASNGALLTGSFAAKR
jgi:hypothetical protein